MQSGLQFRGQPAAWSCVPVPRKASSPGKLSLSTLRLLGGGVSERARTGMERSNTSCSLPQTPVAKGKLLELSSLCLLGSCFFLFLGDLLKREASFHSCQLEQSSWKLLEASARGKALFHGLLSSSFLHRCSVYSDWVNE